MEIEHQSAEESSNGVITRHEDPVRGKPRRRALRLITLAWVFGSVWATVIAGAPLTVFALGLHFTNFEFGVLGSLGYVATLVSMPAALLTERTGKRKIIFLVSLYAMRLMWIPIALVPMWMTHNGQRVGPGAAIVFLVLMFVMYCVGNFGSPAWTSWMNDIVPDRSRGKYFSVRRQIGIVSGIFAALISGWMMDHYGFAGNDAGPRLMMVCSMIFLWSTVFGVADIHLFHYVPDVPTPPRKVEMLSAFSRPFRDRQFLWFAGFVGTLVFAVSFMGQFVTLYLVQVVHVTNTGVQMMTLVAPMLGQLALFSVWGMAADRMGKKPVIAIAALGLVPVGIGWCAMTPERAWLGYVLSTAGGVLWCGVEITNLNLVLEMSSSENGETDSSFYAVNTVLINIAGLLGTLASGWIGTALASMQWETRFKTFTFFDVLFLLSGIMRLAAVVIFLPYIHEPASRPKREALRFMTANIYNNLFSAISQPFRMAGLVRRREDAE